jgi:hypothetical protein
MQGIRKTKLIIYNPRSDFQSAGVVPAGGEVALFARSRAVSL